MWEPCKAEKSGTRDPAALKPLWIFGMSRIVTGWILKTQVERIALHTYTHYKKFPGLPKSEVWASLHRPAKTIHPVTDQLIAEAMGLSAVIGEEIVGTLSLRGRNGWFPDPGQGTAHGG